MKHTLFLHVAEHAGLFGTYATSTGALGKRLGMLQQSISRLLRDLETEEKIARQVRARGTTLSLLPAGRTELETLHKRLRTLFTPRERLTGSAFKGIGEGAYYTKVYSAKIKKVLGFTPFPGTLNVQTTGPLANEFLLGLERKAIEGFSQNGRTFGTVKVYPVMIGKTKGAILRPQRTRYDETVVELIAPVSLRRKLQLKDGGRIEIRR